MATFENDKTVLAIKNRIKNIGIDLDLYIDGIVNQDGTINQITNTWSSTPMGFGFICRDGNQTTPYTGLMSALIVNKRFGMDNMIGGSQHQGVSFREDNQPDSLHIVLCKRADPKMENANCSIHLDSVSVVRGIDPKTGVVTYDMGKILQHLTSDLAHTPMIVVPRSDGIKFGIRF